MFEDIREMIEQLDKILTEIDDANHDGRFHTALELGQQFRDELEEADSDE